ncbi:hypothetical protein LTR36_009878 [Oleoguttula mirabilis]|uniref:HD domain-containing protein n=1 Tax=Oleoguttula mirabilis TaxID=1507867 RepID=A0AAV9J5D4_9PEZI|nr:hypothetical protein LTR36_009878 [Oleoguttula mirabilis]
MPSRTIAGIAIPGTPMVNAAITLAQKHLDNVTYNHIMRSTLLGFAVADKAPEMQARDREVHALAALLHDLSWDVQGKFVSPDKRFEVDSADAARDFVETQILQGSADEAGGSTWPKARLQLLWDAIALHTTPSIGMYKEIEVKAAGFGIFLDFVGVAGAPPGALTVEEWDAVVAGYPRAGFRDGLKSVMCHLCRTKPQTTYDNFVGEFGEELVDGYSRKGKRAFDILTAIVE